MAVRTPTKRVENTPAVDTGDSLFERFTQVSRQRDILVLAAVPIVLIAVFALPTQVRRSFAFHYMDPSLLTAYTAHFVHIGTSHLAGNLLLYGLLAPTSYGLFVLAGRRQYYWTLLAAIFLVFPPVLSYINLVAPRNALLVGFSGLNMGLLGILPIGIAAFARTYFDISTEVRDVGGLFFLSLGAIAMMVIPTKSGSVSIASIAIVGGIVHDGTRNRDFLPSRQQLYDVIRTQGYGEFLIVAGILWFGMTGLAFGSILLPGDAAINTYIHLLGYCLAFMLSYLTAIER